MHAGILLDETQPRSACERSHERSTSHVDPHARIEKHHCRPAAARRDHEGALPQRRHPDPRRADRGAHTAGGAGALRDHRDADESGHVDHLHHPQAERSARDRRPHHACCGAESRSRRFAREGATRGRARAVDGRARGAAARREEAGAPGRAAAAGRGPRRRATTAGSRRCAASRSTCARARSSASPASTATGRAS